jgi:signal peptidase II
MEKRKYLILFSLSGLLLSVDQLVKHWIHAVFSLNQSKALLPFLSLTYCRNNGFAFGLMQRAPASMQGIFFVGVPVFALVLIVMIFIKLQDDQVTTSIALTTILAGAIGNLIDRLQYEYVIDFIDFHVSAHHFPPFNFADCSIIFGVLLMFLNTLAQERLKRTASSG